MRGAGITTLLHNSILFILFHNILVATPFLIVFQKETESKEEKKKEWKHIQPNIRGERKAKGKRFRRPGETIFLCCCLLYLLFKCFQMENWWQMWARRGRRGAFFFLLSFVSVGKIFRETVKRDIKLQWKYYRRLIKTIWLALILVYYFGNSLWRNHGNHQIISDISVIVGFYFNSMVKLSWFSLFGPLLFSMQICNANCKVLSAKYIIVLFTSATKLFHK